MSRDPAARVTFSTAAGRRRAHGWRTAFAPDRLLPLAAAAVVAMMAMALVFLAKGAPLAEVSRGLRSGEIRDVHALRGARDLDATLAEVFEAPGDRAFAAEQLFRAARPPGGRAPANVGALAAVRVAAEPLAARRDLVVYRERAAARLADVDAAMRPQRLARLGGAAAQRARDAHSDARRAATIALLTPDQLRDLKPALAVRTPAAWSVAFAWHALLLLAAFVAMHVAVHASGRAGDPLLLPVVLLLAALGFVTLASLRDPVRDTMLFTRVATGAWLGGVAFVAASRVVYERSGLRRLSLVPLAAALALSLALVVFGSGPGGSDAKVNLLGAQPIEVIRLLLALFLAGWFADRWQLLRELHEPPLGAAPWLRALRLPRLRHAAPVALGVLAAIAFFFLQRDLGPALILIALFLCLYAVCRGSVALALGGLAAIVAAFAVAHVLGVPSTVHLRTAMWLSPWENGLTRGDQLAHALWGFASGGATGTGLGLGQPGSIPAAHTDLVLAAVGEELGFAGVLACAGLYALLVARGLRAARRAPDAYTLFLGLGLAVGIALQTLLISAGALGLVPLSGVVTPFMSYGWSALIMNFAGLGVLWAISASAGATDDRRGARRAVGAPAASERVAIATGHHDDRAFTAQLDPPVRVLAGVLAALAVMVVVKAAWVQLARADATLGRGQLARQADGELRYQYDPRLLGVSATLPRGDVTDRNGVVLATRDWATLRDQRETYRQLGVDLDRACSSRDPRHYPFGGATYHVLGDWVSRRDWGASNTAFVERAEDAHLSGYDDHATTVTVRDPITGERRRVVRRSLAELVPLWRHRFEPGHPQVVAFTRRNHDVRLGLDVRLQLRATRILGEHVRAAGLARGAVVVLDADRGHVLASVSWPQPAGALRGRTRRLPPSPVADATAAAAGPLFDRARFGLYPPGSTFKLVTAAAALERDAAVARAAFPCAPLPGGRVGAVVGGRVIRDDPTDPPHGRPALEEATVLSCNAYYAQLGRRLGWDALERMADRLGISLGDPPAAERPAHLLESSYGQARVLASPLRMARVAGAIAAGGRMPSGAAVWSAADSLAADVVMSASTAATLAGYMRGVVTRGTARSLAGVSPPIAGKTGTAQVANQASHSWFVGYAPHGPARRRVAFAVLVENGGYGGVRAAQVAGEVVAAARDLGLAQ